MRLVPFTPSHFAVLANWFASQREAAQWGGPAASHPVDHAHFDAMVREGRSDPPTLLCWMAEDAGEWVGHAQLAFDWLNGIARLSRIAVAPAARGRGLADPLLTMLVDEAFQYPDIERAELDVYTFNTPALRAYERVGFKTEGVRRSSARVGTERWDTVMMAMLRADWTDTAARR